MNRSLFLGLLALIILCVLCLWFRAPAIEDDLRGKALICLEDAGMDAGVLAISGRDVTLVGAVGSQAAADAVKTCIATISGIRVVHSNLQIVPAVLGFRTQYGDITLWGTVPSAEARTAIFDEAIALWGEGNVTNEIEVQADSTIGLWPDSFAPGLASLHQYRENLEVVLSQGRAVLSGTVVSTLTRDRVLGATTTNLPGFEVIDRLSVREPEDDREALQADLDNLLQGKVVEFVTDGADLTPQGRQVLGEVVKILKANPARVEISGHTDSRQTMEYNLELSLRRAEAVQAYLVKQGLDADRFEVVGYAFKRPIASNDTVEGQQDNRRTEFHALKEN